MPKLSTHALLIAIAGSTCTSTVNAQTDCSDLSITHLEWTAFSDTLIGLRLMNSGNVGWDYPSFDLLNGTELLAQGSVESFAIGAGERSYVMTVVPGAAVPSGAFTATVQLWLGFHGFLGCSFELPALLCPASACIPVFTVLNGNPSMPLDYTWNITDSNNAVAGSGTLTIGGGTVEVRDTLCLAPGNYHYNISVPFPLGEVAIWLEDGITGSANEIFTDAASLPFTVLGPCMDATEEIVESSTAELSVRLINDHLLVSRSDGSPLAPIHVLASNGQCVQRATSTSSSVDIDMSGMAPGIYLFHITGDMGGGTHRFVVQ